MASSDSENREKRRKKEKSESEKTKEFRDAKKLKKSKLRTEPEKSTVSKVSDECEKRKKSKKTRMLKAPGERPLEADSSCTVDAAGKSIPEMSENDLEAAEFAKFARQSHKESKRLMKLIKDHRKSLGLKKSDGDDGAVAEIAIDGEEEADGSEDEAIDYYDVEEDSSDRTYKPPASPVASSVGGGVPIKRPATVLDNISSSGSVPLQPQSAPQPQTARSYVSNPVAVQNASKILSFLGILKAGAGDGSAGSLDASSADAPSSNDSTGASSPSTGPKFSELDVLLARVARAPRAYRSMKKGIHVPRRGAPIRKPASRAVTSLLAPALLSYRIKGESGKGLHRGLTLAVNPVYMSDALRTVIAESYVIPGYNDTPESLLRVKLYASKWIHEDKIIRMEKQLGIPYIRGNFSPAERRLAFRIVDEYCRGKGMTLGAFRHHYFEERGTSDFFILAAQHFAGRPVVYVYQFIQRQFHPGNYRGPWTPEEDRRLKELYDLHGQRWETIGREINRMGCAVRDRYFLVWFQNEVRHRGRWDAEEDGRIIDAIRRSRDPNSGAIPWVWVAEQVETRTPIDCFGHWRSIRRAAHSAGPSVADREPRAPQPRVAGSPAPPMVSKVPWTLKDDYLLCHRLRQSGVAVEDEIDWSDVLITPLGADEGERFTAADAVNREILFLRWGALKRAAQIATEAPPSSLWEQIDCVRAHLTRNDKSPAFIFSEDEDYENANRLA